MKIYIAGPITGNPDYVSDFKQVEKELIKRGHAVINPVKNLGFDYKDYIDMGLCELMKCDAIFVIDIYTNSRGVKLETTYALTVGIKLFESIEDVPYEKL